MLTPSVARVLLLLCLPAALRAYGDDQPSLEGTVEADDRHDAYERPRTITLEFDDADAIERSRSRVAKAIETAHESAVIVVGMWNVMGSDGRIKPHVADFLAAHVSYAEEFAQFAAYAIDLALKFLGMLRFLCFLQCRSGTDGNQIVMNFGPSFLLSPKTSFDAGMIPIRPVACTGKILLCTALCNDRPQMFRRAGNGATSSNAQ